MPDESVPPQGTVTGSFEGPSPPQPVTNEHRPLTAADLRAAIVLAIQSQWNGRVPTRDGPRQYAQDTYECGTACCVHGFAALQAGRVLNDPDLHHSQIRPRFDDYRDLDDRRGRVVDLLESLWAAPQEIAVAAGFILTEAELRGQAEAQRAPTRPTTSSNAVLLLAKVQQALLYYAPKQDHAEIEADCARIERVLGYAINNEDDAVAYQVLNAKGVIVGTWRLKEDAENDAKEWQMNAKSEKPHTVHPLYPLLPRRVAREGPK